MVKNKIPEDPDHDRQINRYVNAICKVFESEGCTKTSRHVHPLLEDGVIYGTRIQVMARHGDDTLESISLTMLKDNEEYNLAALRRHISKDIDKFL